MPPGGTALKPGTGHSYRIMYSSDCGGVGRSTKKPGKTTYRSTGFGQTRSSIRTSRRMSRQEGQRLAGHSQEHQNQPLNVNML